MAIHLDPPPVGTKQDVGKARWDLLPWVATALVVDVMTVGAQKYAPNNWRVVPGWRWRYHAAAMRHVAAWARGEASDPESGLPHLAHAICCLLFILELERVGYTVDPDAEEGAAPAVLPGQTWCTCADPRGRKRPAGSCAVCGRFIHPERSRP